MITQLHDLETLIKDMLLPRASKGDAVTFPKLVEAICKLSEDTLRKQFVEYLEKWIGNLGILLEELKIIM